MRLMLLTPGTGSFYCGSCLRDVALARALRGLGHHVEIAPLYLPLVVEHDDHHHAPVRMGGINVYLQQKTRLARLLPRFVANLLDKPGLLRWASRRSRMTEAADLGPITVSILRGESGRQQKEIDKLVEWIASQPRPDVVIVSNAMLVGVVRRLRAALDVPVVMTLQGEAPFLDTLPAGDASAAWDALRERVAEVDALIAVSHSYGAVMRERLALENARLHVVHNGIDCDGFDGASEPAEHRRPKTIGFLARMCRDKGLDTLVDAFIVLSNRRSVPGLRLRVAGVQLEEDKDFVGELHSRLVHHGLDDLCEFLPNVDRAAKLEFLATLSVLSVPALYGESFGLYLLESMAAGVPVVQPRHAAFPEILEATGGGILCDPGDPAALADALETVLTDETLAARLAADGGRAVLTRFTADCMAGEIASICQSLLHDSERTAAQPR